VRHILSGGGRFARAFGACLRRLGSLSEDGCCAAFRSIPGNFETNHGAMRFTLNPNWPNATCTCDSGDTLDPAYATHEAACTTATQFRDSGPLPNTGKNYHGTGHATVASDGGVAIVFETSVRL
jgi:hypothetical protein